jgi:hypothetical protein
MRLSLSKASAAGRLGHGGPIGLSADWQCHGINSRLPLAFNAAAASNTLQIGVRLWVMGGHSINNQIRLDGYAQQVLS